MKYQEMEPGKEYLVQVSCRGFMNCGYHGTFEGIEDDKVKLRGTTKLNLAKLAMGMEDRESIGDLYVPVKMIRNISAPQRV